MEQQSSYRQVFKATSLFGGVQGFTIIVNILKFKIIAVWLGTSGYGALSLFNTAIQFISSVSNLGLPSSGVREISMINSSKDRTALSKVIHTFKSWIKWTGLAGSLVMVALSPFLSKWLFANWHYTLSFVFLSAVVFLTALQDGFNTMLQGMRRLSDLAKANVVSSIAGLLSALPLYYFYGEKGIVPSLMISTTAAAITTFIFSRKIRTDRIKQTLRETYRQGVPMVKLGIMMSISMIAVYLVEFTVKSYINNYGGIDDVGLYQAGWTLNVSYLGLVFAAMAKDYFPRISEKNANQQLLVNQQAEIALLILCPMILFMLVFLPLGIKLIYSKDFLPIIPMTRLLLVGSLIKSGSWAISFTFLANGDGKTFLKNELGIKCVTLPSYLILYHFFGLIGIGVAYIFNYTVYFILVSIVAYKKYRFYYSKTFWSLLGVIMCFASCCLIISFFAPEKIVYVIGSIVFMLSSLYCLNELNRRINIKEIIIKRK